MKENIVWLQAFNAALSGIYCHQGPLGELEQHYVATAAVSADHAVAVYFARYASDDATEFLSGITTCMNEGCAKSLVGHVRNVGWIVDPTTHLKVCMECVIKKQNQG